MATWTKDQINKMTSEEYKNNLELHGDDFRRSVDEADSQPATRRARNNVRKDVEPVNQPFDPSFDSDSPAPVAVAVAAAAQPAATIPAVAQPAAEPMPREKMSVWSYQPTDSSGRAVGGEQKFFYDPTLPTEHPQSLVSQLTKAHTHSTVELKKRRTQAVIDSVKEVATAYQEPTFLDPKQYPNADAINELARNAVANGTLSALNLFKQNHPEFIQSESSAAAMVGWVKKSLRNPSDNQTWELAWEALKPFLAPEAPEISVPAPAPIAEPVAVAATVEPAVRSHVPIASGLSFADGGDAYQPAAPLEVGPNQGWTYEKIERLPTEQYKKLARDPRMAQLFDRVLQEHEDKRAVARRGR